jgi:hypothetical protein
MGSSFLYRRPASRVIVAVRPLYTTDSVLDEWSEPGRYTVIGETLHQLNHSSRFQETT